MAILIEYKVYS